MKYQTPGFQRKIHMKSREASVACREKWIVAGLERSRMDVALRLSPVAYSSLSSTYPHLLPAHDVTLGIFWVESHDRRFAES